MKQKTISVPNIIILVLVSLMPFHIIFFNLFEKLHFAVLWRDFFVLVLFIFILLSKRLFYLDTVGKLLVLSFLICGIHAFVTHDPKLGNSLWINTYRLYFMPSLIYFISVNLISKETIYKSLLKVFIYTAFGISLFGIFQMFLLKDSFLDLMGYGISSIKLTGGFQRNIGVFDSANIMGLYMVFAIMAIYCSDFVIHGKKIIFIVLFTSLFLTFSISSFISLSLTFIFIRLLIQKKLDIRKLSKIACTFFLFALACTVLFLFIDRIYLDGFFINQFLSRFSEIINTLIKMDIHSPNSASVHLKSLVEPIKVLSQRPLGFGFSTSTYMIYGKVKELAGVVESSIFTAFYDFGLLGGIFYFLPYLAAIFSNRKLNSSPYELMPQMGRVTCLSLFIVFIFLPIIQCYELRFFVFLFMGLGRNPYLRNISEGNKGHKFLMFNREYQMEGNKKCINLLK